MNSRELTPTLVSRIVHATAESRSHDRARVVLEKVGYHRVSTKTIERVTNEVGKELSQLREESPSRVSDRLAPKSPAEPPQLAVVECDGGRIQVRQPGHGPGVHQQAWRETKNACFVTMTHRAFDSDPAPELPDCFCDPEHVAKLAETASLAGVPLSSKANADAQRRQQPTPARAAPKPPSSTDSSEDWRPKKLVRTCLSSMVCAAIFGLQMAREARRRRFFEATMRAFLGDGLAQNWTIWKKHFRNFVPILDFVHAVEYLYKAAVACHAEDSKKWSCYLEWARLTWSGRLEDVLASLKQYLQERGVYPNQKLDEKHPYAPILDAYRYITNNRQRMKYADYRRQGLPVTTALMESLVKQVGQRVKGTDMFWNDCSGSQILGSEAILQVRAAALSEDDRLDLYLLNRPGSPYVRHTTHSMAA